MLYISFLVDFKLYHYNCVRINRIYIRTEQTLNDKQLLEQNRH